MLEDEEAVRRASIAVERINGPILLLSATRDEFWPSTEMSEAIIRRLQQNAFSYPHEHVTVQSGHEAPQRHWHLVDQFLSKHFSSESAADCPR
jgi:predicted esterase